MRRFLARGGAILGALALISAIPATSQASTTAVAPAHAAAPALITRWKLATDLRANPNRNRFSSYAGGFPAWSLRTTQNSSRNGYYKLLPSFSPAFGSAGVQAWHGKTASCVELPAIGVNTTDKPAAVCGARVPGNAAFASPAPAQMPVVAWTSPFDGGVTISHNAVADNDALCGDGVTYYVYLGLLQLTRVRIPNAGSVSLPEAFQSIAKGQSLYFIVTPGPSGNIACDTTQLQITIDRTF